MRTTLDIDEPGLRAIKSLAAQRQESMSKVASEHLARARAPTPSLGRRNGFPVLEGQPAQEPVTMELVNRLRDGAEL